MGNQKSRGTVPSDTITQFGEIARDALLAESASGGLSRMQFFNLIAVERVEHTHWLA